MIIYLVNNQELHLPNTVDIVTNEANKRIVDIIPYKYIGNTKLHDSVLYTIPINSILYIDYNERPTENI